MAKPRAATTGGASCPQRMGRAMSGDDDTGRSGSPPPNLFAAERWARGQEASPGATPLGLGDASATAKPPWLASLLGDRPLSPAEDRVLRVRLLADEFRQAGDEATADALDKAVTPKRGRGRPPKWSSDQRLDLLYAVREVLRADPTLRGSDACAEVAKRPEWQGRSGDALQKRVARIAEENGLDFERAIEGLRLEFFRAT
jgi:hypothetical protein